MLLSHITVVSPVNLREITGEDPEDIKSWTMRLSLGLNSYNTSVEPLLDVDLDSDKFLNKVTEVARDVSQQDAPLKKHRDRAAVWLGECLQRAIGAVASLPGDPLYVFVHLPT